jgi:hypothetical protein
MQAARIIMATVSASWANYHDKGERNGQNDRVYS